MSERTRDLDLRGSLSPGSVNAIWISRPTTMGLVNFFFLLRDLHTVWDGCTAMHCTSADKAFRRDGQRTRAPDASLSWMGGLISACARTYSYPVYTDRRKNYEHDYDVLLLQLEGKAAISVRLFLLHFCFTLCFELYCINNTNLYYKIVFYILIYTA